MLPTPRRLATILILAGAQTGSALNPDGFHVNAGIGNGVQGRSSSSYLTMAVSGIAGSAVLASYAPMFSPHEKLGHQVDFALDVGDNLAPPPGLLKARWVMAEKRGMRMREKRPTADPHERLRQLLIDCGCTAHMVGDVKYLSKVTQVRPDRSVRIANGKIMPVTHVGEAIVSVNAIRRVKRKGKVTKT